MKKYYLICGPIMALGIMAGTAAGAAMDNIKIGVALGIAVGVALSTLAILLELVDKNKKRLNS